MSNYISFDQLLAKTLDQELANPHAGRSVLSEEEQTALLKEAAGTCSESGIPEPLFDEASLTYVQTIFKKSVAMKEVISDGDHPCHWLFEDSEAWFQQSYRCVYSKISFLEFLRFFAAGTTPNDKEIIFRTIAGKLIKTQETMRKIRKHTDFLERYMKSYEEFSQKIPDIIQTNLKLENKPSNQEAIFIGLSSILNRASRQCMTLLKEAQVNLPEPAIEELNKKRYYPALVLSLRHSEALFDNMGSDDYFKVVEHLYEMLASLYAHPEIYLFHHVKREYLTDWLVFSLRENDAKDPDNFFQDVKSEIYEQFDELDAPESLLLGLKDPENLEDEDLKEQELYSVRALAEIPFYDLLFKIYMGYKQHGAVFEDLPLPVQSLAAAGDTSWEQKNIVAQAAQQAEKAKAEDRPVKGFAKFAKTLKRTFSFFGKAKKKEEAAQGKGSESGAAPSLAIPHTGQALPALFPVLTNEVSEQLEGVKQDLSFNDSDAEALSLPKKQEFLVNFFNVNNEDNHPINKPYTKFCSAVSTILKAYESDVQRVNKKTASGGNVKSFTEDLVYLQASEDLIMVLGVTKMGQSKNLGPLPKGKTYYFRVFVSSSVAASLPAIEEHYAQKVFSTNGEQSVFTEVTPTHCASDPQCQKWAVDGLVATLSSLPQSDYQLLADDEVIGFSSLLQSKAQQLSAS